MNKDVKWFQIPNTEVKIPIMDIKGKDYLQVAYRLVWFNLEKPDWSIETEVELDTPEWIRVKCTIKDPSGAIKRTARKSKRLTQDKDADSCETGAIGRCLALLGYGTQFCSEDLEEGEVVDAPQSSNKASFTFGNPKESKVTFDPPLTEATFSESTNDPFWKPKTDAIKKNISKQTDSPGNYKLKFTKKYLGWEIKDIPMPDLQYWINQVEKEKEEKGSLWNEKQDFLDNAYAHIKEWEKNPLNPKVDFEEPLPF